MHQELVSCEELSDVRTIVLSGGQNTCARSLELARENRGRAHESGAGSDGSRIRERRAGDTRRIGGSATELNNPGQVHAAEGGVYGEAFVGGGGEARSGG